MGFIMFFYIIFGTNLLTEGPVPVSVFLPISVFCRKGIPNVIQTEWNLREDLSWNKRNPEDLELKSGTPRGGHEAGGRAQGGRHAPHPRGPHGAPPTYFFRLYILLYPKNIRGSHETNFPLPQPSVPMRSHLGAFSGALPEGESIMEGFYINTIASPMMCE
jgi:hypothetical protein